MNRFTLIAAFLLAAAPMAAPPTTAWAGPDKGKGEEAHGSGSQAPLSGVLKKIAQQHPGKQLNTTMGQAGGRAVYLVQWQLTDGRIVVFTVDVQTGQVVGQ
jgi:uncharacterized membrane protein YkoI